MNLRKLAVGILKHGRQRFFFTGRAQLLGGLLNQHYIVFTVKVTILKCDFKDT